MLELKNSAHSALVLNSENMHAIAQTLNVKETRR